MPEALQSKGPYPGSKTPECCTPDLRRQAAPEMCVPGIRHPLVRPCTRRRPHTQGRRERQEARCVRARLTWCIRPRSTSKFSFRPCPIYTNAWKIQSPSSVRQVDSSPVLQGCLWTVAWVSSLGRLPPLSRLPKDTAPSQPSRMSRALF